MSTSSMKPKREVHYPDSDGKPMGETGIQVNATMELFATLKWVVFGHRPDVYVAAGMFFYYEQGNPKAVKAPDISEPTAWKMAITSQSPRNSTAILSAGNSA